MLLALDPSSSDPPFEQLRAQLTAMVIDGDLVPGDRLPSIRQLAGDLGLASGTVARAYRELEADGVVRSRGARGTTVVGPPHATSAHAGLLDAAAAYAGAASDAGLDLDQAVAALRVAFASVRNP